MITITQGITLIFLVMLSIVDLKTFNLKDGRIPAVLTTSFLLVVFILNFDKSVSMGLFGGLMAMLLVDLDVILGIPDVKAIIAVSMSLQSIFGVLSFGVLMLGITVIFQFIVLKYITKWKKEDIPYIPLIMIAYAGSMGLGMVM